MVWTWQTILVLIIAGVLLIAFIWALVVYFKLKKRERDFLKQIETWKAKAENLESELKRVQALVDNRKLTDAKAIKKLRDRLANWIPG